MTVILEAIKFNHDPDSATTDAFNIRRNETQPVIQPEWRSGITLNPEDSPAAYARDVTNGKTLTIQAKFRCTDSAIASVKVRALDGHQVLRSVVMVNVLGEVCPEEVVFTNGESDFAIFELTKVRIQDVGVSVSDTIWRWQFSVNSGAWTDFATTTHRIYTVLAMPTRPWQPDSSVSSNTQQPWTEVLDYACRWAASATSVPQAAKLVTEQVNGLGSGLVHYDNPQSGSTGFTIDSPPSFDCGDFLLLLRGQPHLRGSGVNCDDCAAFVATFANILGCDLSEARMDHDIPLNPHLRIGAAALETDMFGYHAVAWSGQCGENDEVFDACVQLDSDDQPSLTPHPLFVPANIRFGQLGEHLYRFKLASDPSQCNPVNERGLRRRIGFPKLSFPSAFRVLTDSRDRENTASHIFKQLVSEFVSEGTRFSPWRLQDLYFIDDPASLFGIQSFWQRQDDADVAIRIDAHVDSSVDKASDKLKELLSHFQLRHIKQQEHPEFGDVVHTVPENFVIVFSRRKFVFRLRNVGMRLVSSKAFAQAIDDFLMSQLKSRKGRDKRSLAY